MERRKGLQTVERLLKQGKLQAALGELRKVSDSAPNDLLTLNRLGDLLARQGRNAEAIEYYSRIASQFATGGFVPKAIAIHKKILRLDQQNLESIVQLGELYVLQNLHGEARNYLLHAANQYLQGQQFDKAREVYERLVAADPGDMRHRVRLAEARAAAGETRVAGLELTSLGKELLDASKPDEAEKLYNRARELLPDSPLPVLGLVSCLSEQGRGEDGLALLESAAAGASPPPELVGELALRYDAGGRSEDALALLEKGAVLDIPSSVWKGLFGRFLTRGQVESLWQRLDPVFQRHAGDDPEPLTVLLEDLAEIEEHGHVPALQRLLELQRGRGEIQGTGRALEWLVRAYRARSMHDEASLMLDELREVAPESPMLADRAPAEADAAPLGAPASDAPPAAELRVDPSELAEEVEAPAVPLNRADEEFVAGRLTQAEVLEKYGLRPQALEQLDEVAARFPGHLPTQESRVRLLRSTQEPARLGRALVQMALAFRAQGDVPGARQAAAESASLVELDAATRRTLTELKLLDAEEQPAAVETASSGELIIDFDATAHAVGAPAPRAAPAPEPAEPAEPAAGPPGRQAAGGRKTRQPGADMLEEIEALLEAGQTGEAGRRVDALRVLGYAGEEFDDLAARVSAAEPAEPAEAQAAAGPAIPVAEAPPAPPSPSSLRSASSTSSTSSTDLSLTDLGDDDDLRAITEALESELFEAGDEPIVPEEDPEQSLDEIFASFKAQVQQEIDGDDYQTHYDLGIAYKEMGLVDEAIGEFQIATQTPSLFREACAMIALCHRDRVDMAEAARWYRQALDAPGGEPDSLHGLRYDLAEVLLAAGEREAALDEFRGLLHDDPAYRDVSGRVQELEADLQKS